MFLNNIKFALRSLRKNKVYSFINLLGLTVGVAAALLIFRMVNYELSFNGNFGNYDKIVRVVSTEETPEEGENYSVCIPIPAIKEMKSSVSQFAAISPVREFWATLTIPNPEGGPPLKKFGMSPGETAFFVETDFFRIFDFPWLAGDPSTALNQPNSIVLTQSWAEKCFVDWRQAMGKTVLIDNLVAATVKGVISDPPDNCDFNFPFLSSYKTVENHADIFFYNDDADWGSCSSNDQVYALLHSPEQWDAANAVLATVGTKEYSDESGEQVRFHHLQPISDLHYSQRYQNSGTHRTSKSRIKVLSFIGILILIMACFNFINLATARSILRAKEIGVRKTLGGRRGQLIGQLMSETGVIVALSVAMGANLALLAAPLLKHVSEVPDHWPFFSKPEVILFLILTAVGVTILSGLYPSLSLAKFRPVIALNNQTAKSTFGGVSVRRALVVLQFVIAQALIIGAIIIINQLDYIQSRDLGFSKDLVYTFTYNADSSTVAKQNVLKNKLLQIPTVELVSLSSDQPLSGNTWRSNWRYGSHAEDESFGISLKFADEDYQKAYGLNLLAGKWLPASDTMRHAVINQTVLRKLGIHNPEEAIGEKLRLGGRRILQIVGVVEDFHTHSLRREHEALLISTRKVFYWEAGVKIRQDNVQGTIAQIQKVYDQVLPEQVFNGNFLDEDIAQFYEDDQKLSATCKGFGFLAILISCLGLFGLATHAATQRIKEIGIRKVLGASIGSIIGLLSRDFLRLVLLALVVATPLAWYFMRQWLDNFAFRIDMQWWVFVLAGVMAIVIAFLTVSWQALRAALANPVQALKNE